jgi:hypothetical protein
MKYILRLEDDKGNGANITKPCNWGAVTSAREQAKCLEMRGQKLVIRLCPEHKTKNKSLSLPTK